MVRRENEGNWKVFMFLKELVDEFSIELIEDAVQLRVNGLDNRACRLIRAPLHDLNAYLLETPHFLRYALHPHIAGEQLLSLLSANSVFLEAVISQFSLERFGRITTYGSLGRALGLRYPNPEEIRRLGDISMIAFHPELTPEGLQVAFDELRNRGGRLRVLLYSGFLSMEVVREMTDSADSLGVDPIFLSFLLIGRESSCGQVYAYGYDACMLKSGTLRKLGCMITRETLSKLAPDYPPSSDLVLRRERLNGSLEYFNSLLEEMLFLLEQPIYDSWQVENLLREAKAAKREIERRMRA